MTYDEFQTKFSLALNPQQQEAVRAADGAVLLLAVPGSGKTTVLVTRLGYLIHCRDVRPEEILTMTYTVAATADMRRRFASLFGDSLAQRLEFRTINGVSARIIRQYEDTLGRTAFQLITDEGKLSALVREIYRKVAEEFPTESDIKELRTAITYVKNSMLTEEEIAAWKSDDPNFPKIYKAYCETLRRNRWMDYDDQMVYAYQILRRCPEILRSLQNRYHYLCVDEAQDTSKIQHRIIRLLTGQNLFMVGDEDQSIYGFRAAYPAALTSFEKTYSGAQVLLMERNYRSTPQIVQAADRFIQQNRERHAKHIQPTCPDGPALEELAVYDRRAQYDYLVKIAAGCRMETAVLYRDNDSALPVIDLLNRRGIGYRCRQTDSGFFTHRTVRDVTDVIRFARNNTDGDTFLRIYYKFSSGISKAAAEKAVVLSRRTGEPIFAVLAELPETSVWTKQRCRALHTHLTNLLDEPADRAVYRIVHFMGYGEYLESRGGDMSRLQILEALGAAEPTPERLLARLEELNAIVKEGAADPDGGLILSTIHSSKGLEYDRVILMDVADGILPKAIPEQDASAEERAALEEERRLFYVGMTRAKRRLSIFRFRKEELSSSFTDFLFPRKEPARQPIRPAPKPVGRSIRVQPPVDAAPYVPGLRVVHRRFGAGEIVARQDDVAVLRLSDGSERKILLSVALRQKQLRLAGADEE